MNYWVYMSKIYLGLPQWHHREWYPHTSSAPEALGLYTHSFSSVEGNLSFYGIPSQKNIQSWDNVTPSGFKFCFKFPKEISHKQGLTNCSRQVCEFLNRIRILNSKLGVVWLQLDQYFAASSMHKLERFLRDLPTEFDYAVEVRNLEFYQKDAVERQLNQLLQRLAINRVIFDTRSFFANDSLSDSATIDALKVKPQVPTHALNTGRFPFVRILLPMDVSLGMYVIKQWVSKVVSWLDEGLVPYLFFHTPDNASAPQLAKTFSQLLNQQRPEVKIISLWNELAPQRDLF